MSAFLLLLGSLHLHLQQAGAAETPAADTGKLKELSIEELMEVEVDTVYGASRYEQKLTDAPSSVTIVTDDQIRKFGYRTLADILKSVRGFYVTNDRNYSYVGVRGFGRPSDYNSRILIQLNGHRLNDNLYGGAYVGQDTVIDVDLIDRVEIIRGPSSSLYGNNAFFAVVNMITKKGEELRGVETSASAASYDTYKGRVSYGNLFPNGLGILLSGSGFNSDGHDTLFYKEYYDPDTNSNGKTHHTDYENGFNFFGSLSYGDFTLEGAYNSREKGIPTGSYGTDFNDPGNYSVDRYGFVDLKYGREFPNGLGLVARTYYNHVDYKGDWIFDEVVNKDNSRGDQWGLDLMLKKTLGKHTIIVGSEYEDNLHQEQRNYDKQPYNLLAYDHRDSWKTALYAQGEFAIHRMLNLNMGVRWDYYDTFGSTVNPRLALIFKPFEKTALKFVYGEAFRAPNVYELFYNDGGATQKANPDLKPESITTYELIYEQNLGKHLLSTISLFHYDIDNLISQIEDPDDSLLVFRNISKSEANGVEFELACKWGNGFETRGSYSYQYAKDNSTDRILSNSPMHLAKINAVIPILPERIFSGVELQYTGKRKTLSYENAGGFILTNVTLFGHNLLKNLDFTASVYNLFDKKYGDPGASEHLQDIIEQDGRTFRVKLTYKF